MTVESNRPPLTGDPVVGYPINHPPPPPGAAAFFDGAPPPSLRHDKNFNPHSQQLDFQNLDCVGKAKLVCSVISFALCFLLIPASIVGLGIATRPYSPQFRADSLSVSDFNISDNNLVAGNWDLRFTVRNRNRELDVDYEHICAEILYDSAPLAQAIVRPFYLGPKDETSSEARFAADGTVVKDWIVERVNREKPYIEFNVRFTARISHPMRTWRPSGVEAYCGNLKVRVDGGHGSSGDLSGGPKLCRVDER
ncbi:unnamed protein product [Cuscuta campestris]|uniref:Late embryogenesis abundant protein LEA-2 subgroup domain-containing protein n=1 Tax=Cuscuta campestris TaxID=132261 RepID=A0A484NPD8_9ASTE|nr:unnamed protein product [Cuscuta campestris]